MVIGGKYSERRKKIPARLLTLFRKLFRFLFKITDIIAVSKNVPYINTSIIIVSDFFAVDEVHREKNVTPQLT